MASREGMGKDDVAELSRLRAFAIRVGPVVKAAVELRELGRSLERLEEHMDTRADDGWSTRSGTPWLILKQGYDTALEEFDAKVKAAGLGHFADLLGGHYSGSALRDA